MTILVSKKQDDFALLCHQHFLRCDPAETTIKARLETHLFNCSFLFPIFLCIPHYLLNIVKHYEHLGHQFY